jgi:hypothetical protein
VQVKGCKMKLCGISMSGDVMDGTRTIVNNIGLCIGNLL